MTGETVASGSRGMPGASDDPLLGTGGRCVVGFDASASSRAALSWAAGRTLPSHPMHLLGVIEDDADGRGADVAGPLARAMADAVTGLQRAHPGSRISTGVERGAVADALAAGAGPHDLVVIGSDKTGYARGRLLGARAIELAAAMRGAMALIPSVDLRLRTGVAVALSDPVDAQELARRGALEAALRGCALTLVHAVRPGDDGPHSSRADAVLTAARGAALAACPGLEVTTREAHRHPADAILDVSRGQAVLMLGRARDTTALGVGRTLLEVLMNANAPTVAFA